MNKFTNTVFVTENYGDRDLLLIHFIFIGSFKIKFIFYNTYKCIYGVQCFDTGIHCVIFKIKHPDILKC